MEVRASWRLVARPAKAAGPALAAFLVTSAGVAAIAQPMGSRPEPASSRVPPVLAPKAIASARPATIRLVLTPPAPPTPTARAKPDGSPGFVARRLDAVSTDQGATTPVLGGNLPKPATAPLRMTPPQAAEALQLSAVDHPATMRTISPRPEPKAIPVVDTESRATLARMNGDGGIDPSSTERDATLRPVRPSAPARALVDAAPREAKPLGLAPVRMQDEDGISRYRQTAQGLAFDVATTINGTPSGKVSLLIRDGENISIRLADLLAAVQPAIDPALYQKLGSSAAARGYMTFNELREAGVAVRFSDDDRLILGIK